MKGCGWEGKSNTDNGWGAGGEKVTRRMGGDGKVRINTDGKKKMVPGPQREQRKDTNQSISISTWSMLPTREQEVTSASAGQLGANK